MEPTDEFFEIGGPSPVISYEVVVIRKNGPGVDSPPCLEQAVEQESLQVAQMFICVEIVLSIESSGCHYVSTARLETVDWRMVPIGTRKFWWSGIKCHPYLFTSNLENLRKHFGIVGVNTCLMLRARYKGGTKAPHSKEAFGFTGTWQLADVQTSHSATFQPSSLPTRQPATFQLANLLTSQPSNLCQLANLLTLRPADLQTLRLSDVSTF